MANIKPVKPSSSRPREISFKPKVDTTKETVDDAAVPYDESLLERARSQWQFSDWQSLSELEQETLQHHPDRAKLALLGAAGRLQAGKDLEAKKYLRLARDWGASRKMIAKVLIAGVYNSLGRLAALSHELDRSQKYFEGAIQITSPWENSPLIKKARINLQIEQLHQKIEKYRENSVVGSSLYSEKSTKKTKQLDVDISHRKNEIKANYLNGNGQELFEVGRYKLAAEFFQRALELIPNNALYCLNLAEAVARLDFRRDENWECNRLRDFLDRTNKWEVVVHHYRKALQLDSKLVFECQQRQIFQVRKTKKETISDPVFIVGCGHSGTSLMLVILGNHPNYYPITKESALFLCTDQIINKTLKEWDEITLAEGKTRWVEKTPPHIFQIHRFLAFRPKAKFILMLRDGRDVVSSLRYRKGYKNIQDRIDRWVYDNVAGLNYWKHPQVKVVKYEDLVAIPERTLRDICQFLDDDYSSEMLKYHANEYHWYSNKIEKPEAIENYIDHKNLRNWQINQPIFDGRGRWKQDMTQAEKKYFKQSKAQSFLEKFGYVNDSGW